MFYYKIIENPKAIGTIINTEENFDSKRIERFSSLKQLFKLLFEVSKSFNISLYYILTQIYPEKFSTEIAHRNEPDLLNDINKIKEEMIRTNFDITSEYKYFNDFVLDMVRAELPNITKFLPDRFKSHYFFETIEECKQYYSELSEPMPCKIVQVNIINKKIITKLDNRHLTNFQNHYTSDNYYHQAKACLFGVASKNPLYEIVFQGTYQITSHLDDL